MPLLLAVSIIALCSSNALAQSQDAGAIASPPAVVAQGHAIVNARPDRAFVTIAAESRSRNSGEAQKQNATAMTSVLQKIEQAGVPKDAIRTIGYDLQPEFDYAGGRQAFRGYLARNTVEVRLDDIDRVGAVIDAAAAGGATTITGVRFDVRDRAALEQQALRLAVADARGRADALAAGAGAKVDRIIRIEEGLSPGFPRPMARMGAQAVAASVPTPIEPATIEIQAQVTLTAAIR
jgi:uncharacterized protein YggE